MKKILLFILLSFSIYGQNPTRFPYGVQITGGQTSTAESSKLLSQQPGTGTVNYINATALPISTAVIDSLSIKENINTGFISGLALSINVDNTKFDIAPGIYAITDYTDLQNPVTKVIVYAGATGITPTYLATANASYIELDINGNIIQSSSPFTDSDRRTKAIIGAAIHSNNININVVNEIKAPIVASTNQLHDLMRIIGSLNISGNIYGANGANLQLDKTAGVVFALGINPQNYLDPNTLSLAGQTGLTFRYRTQTGIEGSDVTTIDPNTYDVSGTITAVPVNKWTVQRYNLFQSNTTRVQRGQTLYNSFNEALTLFPTSTFVTEQNIAENAIFRAYLIIKEGTTDLQAAITAGTAKFIPVDKFGNIVTGGSIALTYANIIAALGYVPADDTSVVHKTGNETISGDKSYDRTNSQIDAVANDLSLLNKRYFYDSAQMSVKFPYNLNNNYISTVIGDKAGKFSTVNSAVLLGWSAGERLVADVAGNGFVGVGKWSLQSAYGSFLTSVGDDSGKYQRGNSNVYFGEDAGQVSIGDNNVGIGTDALKNNEGNNNIQISSNDENFFTDSTNQKTYTPASIVGNQITLTSHGLGAPNSYINMKVLSATVAGRLVVGQVYMFKIIDANTIEKVDDLGGYDSLLGTENGIMAPQFRYNNTISIGNGAISRITNSNQIVLGDTNITELLTSANITASSFAKSGGTSSQALLANGGILTNPISGVGVKGQIAFWDGISTQTGDNSLFWDSTNKRFAVGTTTPSQLFDVYGMVGAPATTGTIQGGVFSITSPDVFQSLYFGIHNSSVASFSPWIQAANRNDLSTSSPILLNPNGGNVLLGGLSDDGINKLQVTGSTKTSSITISTTPATSAGTYDFLTRNISTGVVEKVLSNTIATISGNNIFSGNNSFSGTSSYSGAITMDTGGASDGISIGNNLATRGIYVTSNATGKGVVINNTTGATGIPLTVTKNGIDNYTVTDGGLVMLGSYTVATLPTPTTTAYATVTDATTPTYLGTLTGGGAVVCPVFYNGTIWVSH